MDESKTFEYVKLANNIFIPAEWPISGLDKLVLTLARKIIDQNNGISSILQLKDIPAKLVTQTVNSGLVHVFEKVSKM